MVGLPATHRRCARPRPDPSLGTTAPLAMRRWEANAWQEPQPTPRQRVWGRRRPASASPGTPRGSPGPPAGASAAPRRHGVARAVGPGKNRIVAAAALGSAGVEKSRAQRLRGDKDRATAPFPGAAWGGDTQGVSVAAVRAAGAAVGTGRAGTRTPGIQTNAKPSVGTPASADASPSPPKVSEVMSVSPASQLFRSLRVTRFADGKATRALRQQSQSAIAALRHGTAVARAATAQRPQRHVRAAPRHTAAARNGRGDGTVKARGAPRRTTSTSGGEARRRGAAPQAADDDVPTMQAPPASRLRDSSSRPRARNGGERAGATQPQRSSTSSRGGTARGMTTTGGATVGKGPSSVRPRKAKRRAKAKEPSAEEVALAQQRAENERTSFPYPRSLRRARTLGAVPLYTTGEAGAEAGDGVAFRVWAPGASAVSVVGSWNKWSRDTGALREESDGEHFSGVIKAAGDGDVYMLVLRIGDEHVWRNDPAGRCLRPFTTESALPVAAELGSRGRRFLACDVVYRRDAFAFSPIDPPAPSEMVLYEMHIGTFSPEGTWLGAIERIPYLLELGVNAVAMLPPTCDQHDICWGYDPVSLFAPHPPFGSPDDTKSFVEACHRAGVAVIVDWVPNHLSVDSVVAQFDKLPVDKSPRLPARPGTPQSRAGSSERPNGSPATPRSPETRTRRRRGSEGSYFYAGELRKTPYGPRPDLGNDQVRRWLLASLAVWLDEYNMDGVRVDSCKTLRGKEAGSCGAGHEDLQDAWTFMQLVTDFVRARGKLSIAEDLGGDARINVGVAGFDAQWDDSFHGALRTEMVKTRDVDRSVTAVAKAVVHSFLGAGCTDRVIYSECHDTIPEDREKRLPAAICQESPTLPLGGRYGAKRALLAGAVLLTARGIPMLCQGQELSEVRGPCWPMPLVAPTGPVDGLAGAILQQYSTLCRARSNANGNTRGLTGRHVRAYHVNERDKVMAWHRWEVGGAADDVICIANCRDRGVLDYQLGLPRGGAWTVRVNTDCVVEEEAFSPPEISTFFANVGPRIGAGVVATTTPYDGLPFSAMFDVGPYSLLVLSRDAEEAPSTDGAGSETSSSGDEHGDAASDDGGEPAGEGAEQPVRFAGMAALDALGTPRQHSAS